MSNFDFHTMEAFIADMLLNYELYQHKLFVFPISDVQVPSVQMKVRLLIRHETYAIKRHMKSPSRGLQYAAPLKSPHSYDGISRDILQRWCYPFVPDTNWQLPRPAVSSRAPQAGGSRVFLTPLAAPPDPLRESLYKLCVDPPHTRTLWTPGQLAGRPVQLQLLSRQH